MNHRCSIDLTAVQEVGTIVPSSKLKYMWLLDIEEKLYTILLYHSKLSKKYEVLINNKRYMLKKGISEKEFKFAKKIRGHEVEISYPDNGKNFQLFIDKKESTEMAKKQHQKAVSQRKLLLNKIHRDKSAPKTKGLSMRAVLGGVTSYRDKSVPKKKGYSMRNMGEGVTSFRKIVPHRPRQKSYDKKSYEARSRKRMMQLDRADDNLNKYNVQTFDNDKEMDHIQDSDMFFKNDAKFLKTIDDNVIAEDDEEEAAS